MIRLCASFVLLVAVAMVAGGAVLVRAGGSPYYLIAGIVLVASGVLLWRGNPRAVGLYAIFLLATILWSLWEVGLDGWALMPRLIGPAVFGAILLFLRKPYRAKVPDAALARKLLLCSLVIVSGLYVAVVAGSLLPTSSVREASGGMAVGDSAGAEWTAYGGDLGGTRYSSLDQIGPNNVSRLKLAWIYRTRVGPLAVPSPLEATPLKIGTTLYFCTQTNIVIALDAETGRERWRFDPKVDRTGATFVSSCRGVAFARVADDEPCPERIIAATFDARLIALDARTGTLCRAFGRAGQVDLLAGMGRVEKGFYYVSSAPLVMSGRIVVGGYVRDNDRVDVTSGVIRAFDARSGQLAWAWDMGRPDHSGLPPLGLAYTRGTANSWAPMSGDPKLGMIFVPMGNSTPDHWGAHRSTASERYASGVVALDIGTGRLRWNRQFVHHDVWDYDVASQPTLVDLPLGGERIPALIQPTKQGQLFVLDRRDGRAIAPVKEIAVPQGAVAGDWLSRTQPFSTGMPSFAGKLIEERDMWGVTPLDQLWCRVRFRNLAYRGMFTPPTTKPTLIMPGLGGGFNWGGVSVDPTRGLLTANTNFIPSIVRLIPRAEADAALEAARRSAGVVKTESLAEQATGTPFAVTVTNFLSPLYIPCTRPPFGTLSSVDLVDKSLRWSRPLGDARASGPLGIASRLPIPLGTPNFGGSIMTRSGLTVIGASQEPMLRAFDSVTGRLLWQTSLPAGGQTTPMTYVSPKSGRQFIVIVAGGSVVMGSPTGDYVLGFALPKSGDTSNSLSMPQR